MKKVLLILVIAMMVPVMASAGSGVTNTAAGDPLKLVGLTIATSPGVFAYYEDDTTTQPQWYAIGTLHQGGTKAYATAQNSTSILHYEFTTSPLVATSLSGLTFPTQTAAASVDGWPEGWTQ